MTRARGIDHRGNSVELVTGMTAADLAELLCEGGWKWVMVEVNGRPAAWVTLNCRELRRQARVA